MASKEPHTTRKPVVENVARVKPGADQDPKKKKTYKSTHSIGSRKATEKVVTYSETLPYYADMVQQYFNDRELEPKKASPAKPPAAKAPPAKTTSSAKTAKVSSPKSATAKSTAAKSSSTKASSGKASSAKSTPSKSSPGRTSVGKSPVSGSSQAKSSSSGSSGKKRSNSVEASPKGSRPKSPQVKTGVKRKNSDDSSSSDSSEAKKPRVERQANSVTSSKALKTGTTDSRISVAEKLKKITAKAEEEEIKKRARASTKKNDSNKTAKKANDAASSKSKKSEQSPAGGKKEDQTDKKAPKKKPAKKKKEEKEIPSLSSFIKPKREASLFANAMMDIMFEKPLPMSPRKESKSPPKSASNGSLTRTPSNQAEDSIPANAKKKLTFEDGKSSKGKKTEGGKKGAAAKGSNSRRTKKKSDDPSVTPVLKGKVGKRKSKKRMASLNARALIVAERESLQMVLERAARTDRYCVSWTRHSLPSPRPTHRSARWVDGTGANCGVCCPAKKEGGVTEITAVGATTTTTTTTPPMPVPPESKVGVVGYLSPTALQHDKDQQQQQHVMSEERPSSVVDVVTTPTPHPEVAVNNSHPNNNTYVKKAAPPPVAVNGSVNNYTPLYNHSQACLGPCPGYTYSRTEGYVTTSASYQSFTLRGIGTLNPVPLMAPMAPSFRASAFTVPGYNMNLPYGYYPSPPYYQPTAAATAAAGTLLPHQALPEPCMLPHHMAAIRVPHGQVKVLIHNPDPPQDLAAFSEHRSPPGKGGDATASLHMMVKVANDSNNNRGGLAHHHHHHYSKSNTTLATIPAHLSTSSSSSSLPALSKKHGLDKAGGGSTKSEASRKKEPSEGKKKDGENKRKDSSDSKKKDSEKKKDGDSSRKKDSDSAKSVKNGENPKKTKDGEKGSKKDGDGPKKKDNGHIPKAKDAKDGTKAVKKKAEKKKKAGSAEKGDSSGTDGGKSTADSKEESIPEHGWVWVGEPESKKVVSVHWDQPSEERQCYKAIRHSTHGDIINVRDCVLLRSGCVKSDVPYVAKVGALWEHPKTKEMMMSLLWYYQPEHTEAGRRSQDMENEVFASRHRDENSVACIDDKCFVLTFDQYCRYQAEMRRVEHQAIPRNHIVPDLDRSDPDVSLPQRELPNEEVDPDNIFCCRKVYDFRMKRILKNPC